MAVSKSNLGHSLASLQEALALFYLGASAFGIRYSDLTHLMKGRTYDTGSWSRYLVESAARYEKLASEALETQRIQSAMEWLRDTASYYYFAQIFLPVGDQKATYQARSRSAYEQMVPLLDPPCEKIMIPFMGTHIPGYLRVSKPGAPCVLVVGPGSDPASKEVVSHKFAEVFLKRGMSVVYFDGPGQGELIGKLAMRAADFDNAISAIIDFVVEQKQVINTKKIAIFGASLGAYFAMRSSVKDDRIIACVSLSGNLHGPGLLNLPPMARKDMLRKFGFTGTDESNVDPNDYIPPISALERKPEKPLLLIQGGKDNIVTVEEQKHLQEWIQGQMTEAWFYEDAEHVCYSHFPEILPAMGDWMAQRLLP
uniref:Lysophospholipase, alpha-beta hydrolase superfamily n=1 Tax=Candidatus Kentrum sp. FW TaxID=2126338 RepID=A0A450U079_9GAMM|nr:MAG: Lysophospholipase, alpha-beta hydrolase superfamily [Candidatus Kentron sp. FW]